MKKILTAFISAIFIFTPMLTTLAVDPLVENVNVNATVLGIKPLVYDLSPTTGDNGVTTGITAIVGRNFTGAYAITLDDESSTSLTGTIAVVDSTDNVATDPTVGGGGTFQKITGMTVPSGVVPGTYNILVTTSNGTNIVSDTKFVVTGSLPAEDATIGSLPTSTDVVISTASSVALTLNDGDSDPVYWHITNFPTNTINVTWDNATGSIPMVGGTGTDNL